MSERKPKNIFTPGAIPAAFIAESIQKHSTQTGIGGHSIFLGQVRSDVIETKTVAAIDYTAYEDMALEKMQEIREAIFAKYPLTCMHVHHSLGKVAAGEICFYFIASPESGHQCLRRNSRADQSRTAHLGKRIVRGRIVPVESESINSHKKHLTQSPYCGKWRVMFAYISDTEKI